MNLLANFYNQLKKPDLVIIRFYLGRVNIRWTFLKVEKWGERGYALKDQDYEGIYIGVDEGEFHSAITLNYFSYDEKGREDLKLKMINDRVGQELEYEEFPSENSTLYLSYFETEMYYGYAGFLQNEE